MPFLSILVFLPLAWWGVSLAIREKSVLKYSFLGCYFIQLFLLSTLVLSSYQDNFNGYLSENYSWINISIGQGQLSKSSLSISYHLELNGLNVLMVLLNCILFPLVIYASKPEVKPRLYYFLLALLNTSLLGCFLAQDFFLFYLFYEFMLIPMYFLIGIWGGANRQYAAIKFFLYTLLGSVFMLLVMVGLVFSYELPNHIHSFSLSVLGHSQYLIENSFFALKENRDWAFWALFIAFGIKLPIIPFHTWLPDAHVQASTPISMLLAGILLKVGGYGIFKIAFFCFPDIAIKHSTYLIALATLAIIYGGLCALGQKDLKRMIAYSSIAHMGFVLLGAISFNSVAMNGAFLQMFNHGIISAGLFFLAGILYERVQSYEINNFKGLWNPMPKYTFFILITFFAGMGIPGFSAFVSELLIFAGAFHSSLIPTSWLMVCVFGIFISAVYFLWTIKRMFMGNFETTGGDQWQNLLKDLNNNEIIILSILSFFTIWGGIYPQPFLSLIENSVKQYIEFIFNQ